ncbi:MAG: hypothetical protein M0P20_07665 [Methanocorpusculum sp.]|nr:hypothetical protein [Methanocorpusculum sp.]
MVSKGIRRVPAIHTMQLTTIMGRQKDSVFTKMLNPIKNNAGAIMKTRAREGVLSPYSAFRSPNIGPLYGNERSQPRNKP